MPSIALPADPFVQAAIIRPAFRPCEGAIVDEKITHWHWPRHPSAGARRAAATGRNPNRSRPAPGRTQRRRRAAARGDRRPARRLALGDIGEWFPDTAAAPGTRLGATSVRTALQEVRQAGYEIVNFDCIVFAQQPKLSAHKPHIRRRLAELLGVSEGDRERESENRRDRRTGRPRRGHGGGVRRAASGTVGRRTTRSAIAGASSADPRHARELTEKRLEEFSMTSKTTRCRRDGR